MNETNEQFISNVAYFWFEKGDVTRYVNFSVERLEQADPVLASAYKNMVLADETFSRLLKQGSEDL